MEVLKIGILKNYLKMEFLKIKFGNWNFGKLFENWSFENWNFGKLCENWSFETNFWKQEWRIKEMRTCGLWEWFIEGGILKLT